MKLEEKAATSSEQRRFLQMVIKYLRPYTGSVLLLLLVYASFTVLTAIQPVILAPILDIAINKGLPQGTSQGVSLGDVDLNNIGQYILGVLGLNEESPLQVVLILAIAYLGVSIGTAGLNFLNYLLSIRIRATAGRDIQLDLFSHLFSLSLDFFNNERTGEIIARLDQDTRNAMASLEVSLRNMLISPLLILYYGYLMLITNITLTIFVVAAALMHYLLTRALRRPIRRRTQEQVNIGAEVTAYLQEKLASARVVKTFVAETIETNNLRNLINQFRQANIKFGFFKHLDDPVTASINAVINVGILLFSINELFSGRLTVTGFLLYLFIGRSILTPLTTLTQSYNSIQSTLAIGVRVRQLFDIEPSVRSGTESIREFNDSIRFDNVFFSYKDFPVLHEISFEIEKGKTTALVGPSGGGKSTITDLLLRFYDPHLGKVLVDGVDLRALNLSQYRRLYGVVAQESILFNASISANIAYGYPDLTKEEIQEAARIAYAHEFIGDLPEGYDTLVGDRGVRLSGGQRQRIAIARAIAHRPKILILDEATSSLDTEAEQKVQLAVDRAIQSTTAIVIAHRLSTVVRADQIIVIDEGRVVDKGTHQELMSRSKLYKTLASLQFNSQVDVSGPRERTQGVALGEADHSEAKD
ncbi:MAG: ABC transporter ATP-binding protein [Anaerolineales bacterium]